MSDLNRILEKVKDWARDVGKIQKRLFRSPNLQVMSKSSESDLVTEVDQQSEAVLIDHISKAFPTHSILSEESGLAEQAETEFQWVVDPLDGTNNYVHGLPIFAVSIALRKGRDTVLGLVYAPYLEEMYWAIKNRGAFLNGTPISVSTTSTLGKSILSTGFPYNMAKKRVDNLDYFKTIAPKVRGIRRLGAAAYDLCLVASGCLDGFWEFSLNEWDYLAGNLIVEEAGGRTSLTSTEGVHKLVAGNKKVLALIVKEHRATEERRFP